MTDAFKEMYDVIVNRRDNPQEGSYTCYLFEKGIDKILKKCGEETMEMAIAAKNKDNDELAEEINDVLYHMAVLMVERGLSVEKVDEIMRERSKKIGNLKQFHVSDHNT
ncbi:MAG: phosphoribosyl-ATP diphosphatase [Oscillospiraceae bacterium]